MGGQELGHGFLTAGTSGELAEGGGGYYTHLRRNVGGRLLNKKGEGKQAQVLSKKKVWN